MITDRIGRDVLLPINHKNYNFREKKNNQAMKERLIVSFILQPCSFAVFIIEIRLIKIKDVRLAILLANS